MIFSDEENRFWWNSLSKAEQSEIIEKIEEFSDYPDWAGALRIQYNRGHEFDGKQLASIRKWAK